MKLAFRVTGIFILQLLTLLVVSKLIGNPIMSATIWRVPLGSCHGYDLDFRFMIGLTAASIILASFLALKDCRRSTVWSFVAALVSLDILYASHLKFPSPCF